MSILAINWNRVKSVNSQQPNTSNYNTSINWNRVKSVNSPVVQSNPEPQKEKSLFDKSIDLLKGVNRTKDALFYEMADSATLGALSKLENKSSINRQSDWVYNPDNPNKTTSEKVAGGIGNLSGYLLPVTGAYKTGGKLAQTGYKGLTKGLSPTSKLGKTSLKVGERATTGLGAGAAFSTTDELLDLGLDTKNDGSQTGKERLGNIGKESLLFAGGDVALSGLGYVGKKGLDKVSPKLNDLLGKFNKGKMSKEDLTKEINNSPELRQEVLLLTEPQKQLQAPAKTYKPKYESPTNQTTNERLLLPEGEKRDIVNLPKTEPYQFTKQQLIKGELPSFSLDTGLNKYDLERKIVSGAKTVYNRKTKKYEMVDDSKVEFLRKGTGSSHNMDVLHKKSVENAINQGKSIPDEVLNEYPDLAKKVNKESSTTEQSLQFKRERYVPMVESNLNYVGKLDPLNKMKIEKPKIKAPKPLQPTLTKSINKNTNLSKVDNIQSNKEVATGKESINLPKQEENIILSSEKKPFSLKETWNKFYENTFNSQDKFKNISKETVIKGSNARQTQGVVDYIAQNGLVDKEGRKIGESLSELIQSVPKDKEKDFWRYVAHKHNVSRAAEGKNVFSQFSSEDSMKEAKKILSENPEFEAKGKNITGWINKFMDNWADDLIGEETLDLWKAMYPDYFPANREMNPLKKADFNNAKKGFVNQDNTVKKAKGAKSDGSSDIKDPSVNITSLVNKIVKASKNNEVGLEIVKEVRKGNLDEFFEIVPTKQGLLNDINKTLKEDGIEGLADNLIEQFDDIYKQAEKGNNIVKVMENGKEVHLKVKDADYLKALKSLGEGTGESAAEQFERAARKVSRPIKDLITSKNPLFGVYNAARDLTASFIQGQEKNPIKFTNRYFKSLKEITSNSKGFQEFVAQGGMQSGFFKNDITKTVGKLKNPNASTFEKFIRKVEGFNNVIEAIPRYMEYMATLEKGGTKAEGIYNAAEVSVNFARSGKWGKFFDSFVLYLNPALQGLDKFVRQVKNKPLQTSLKAAGVITVPTIITDNANKDNPNYQALDQRTKDDFFLIPNKFGAKDEEGNAETFFKVPKARQYSVLFSVLVNRIGEITDGKSVKDASKGVSGSLNRNFSVPTRPIWAPFTDVKSNKDWKGAPINPLGMELDNRSNYLKYDEKTSEVGKMLSKLLNEQPIEEIKYSPKEIDYLLDSFTGIVGDLVLPATTKSESVSGVPKRKFVADSVYSNQEVTDFYNNLNKSRTAATDNNLLKGIPSSVKTKEERDRDALNDISKEMGRINDLIRKSDEDKQRELRKEIIRLAKIGNDLYNKQK